MRKLFIVQATITDSRGTRQIPSFHLDAEILGLAGTCNASLQAAKIAHDILDAPGREVHFQIMPESVYANSGFGVAE